MHIPHSRAPPPAARYAADTAASAVTQPTSSPPPPAETQVQLPLSPALPLPALSEACPPAGPARHQQAGPSTSPTEAAVCRVTVPFSQQQRLQQLLAGRLPPAIRYADVGGEVSFCLPDAEAAPAFCFPGIRVTQFRSSRMRMCWCTCEPDMQRQQAAFSGVDHSRLEASAFITEPPPECWHVQYVKVRTVSSPVVSVTLKLQSVAATVQSNQVIADQLQ